MSWAQVHSTCTHMQAFPDRQALPVNNKMAEHFYIIIILLQILELLVVMVTATFYYHRVAMEAASIFFLKREYHACSLAWAVLTMGYSKIRKQSCQCRK